MIPERGAYVSLSAGLLRGDCYTGRSPGHAVGMAGCGHSKIARVLFVFVLYWPFLLFCRF